MDSLWWELKSLGGKGLNVLQVLRLEMTGDLVHSASPLSWLPRLSACLCLAIDNFDPVTGSTTALCWGSLVFCPLGFLRGAGPCDWPHMGKLHTTHFVSEE